MSFAGPLATGLIELEVVPPSIASVQAAAQRSAQEFSNSFQRSLQGLERRIQPFRGAITGAAIGIAALTAVSVKLGASFAKTAGNFQELEQSLNAIITNSTTARTSTEKFIGSLRSLALQSGRSSEQLANTGRQFLALGFSGDKTTEILTAFTKAASLTGATNQQLGLALNGVSQIASKGAVSMEELRRQIAENLPGAVSLSRFFEILAENMGITVEEAKKLQQQGLIGAEIGIAALVETVNEATEGIDVFALRARTLNGLMGILRESFTQSVQTGFRPFVDALTEANSGPLGQFIDSLRNASSGGGGLSAFEGLIGRLGQTLGTSFRDILNEIIPLIPQLANLFVTLVEAFAPVVVDIVRIGTTLAQVLLPPLTAVATAARFLFNELGPLSFILRQLAAGAILGGLVNALGAVGRALGSFGGFIGRIATPLSRAIEPLARLDVIVGAISAGLGILNPILSRIAIPLGALATAAGTVTAAFILFHQQQRIIAAFTAFQTALSIRGAAVQAFAGFVGRLVTQLRVAITQMGAFRLAVGAIAFTALTVGIAGVITAFQRMEEQTQRTLAAMQQGIDRTSVESLSLGVDRINAKLVELEKRSDSTVRKIVRGFLGASKLTDKLVGDDELNRVRELGEEFEEQGRNIESVLTGVTGQTGASLEQIRAAASQLGIDLGNILGEDVPKIITRLVNSIRDSVLQLGTGLARINEIFTDTIDQQEKLITAQKNVESAQRGVTDAVKREKEARDDVTDAIEKEQDAIENVGEAVQREADAKERLQLITDKLTSLETRRLELINDTTRDIRELSDAQDDLTRIEFRLLDIEQQRQDTLEKIAELQAPATADEIADADRDVTRAKLALNKAIREEQEFLASLNAEQQSSVDLSGLTLDQLRTQLAGIRASLAAQRAVTKGTRSQEEIEEERLEKHLDVEESQDRLNDAILAREELDQRVIKNQEEIARLTRGLVRLELDKKRALLDQKDAQNAIALIQSGETSRLIEIRKLDEDIVTQVRAQRDATRDVQTATRDIVNAQSAVRDATLAIRDAQNNVRDATFAVRDAEFAVRDAKSKQQLDTALILGSEQDINNALRARFGLNAQLATQSNELLTKNIQALIPTLFAGSPGLPFALSAAPQIARKIADLILTNPNALRDYLRGFGLQGFAEGGLITSPMIAKIGEGFKHEMVLPLTKPDRVWDLMSKTLPKYPGAMRAAQNAISPAPIANQVKALNLGSNRVVPRNDGPATYGQIQELIKLLKEHRTEVRIEAPITLENNGSSESLLARKISRQLKREILDELGKR